MASGVETPVSSPSGGRWARARVAPRQLRGFFTRRASKRVVLCYALLDLLLSLSLSQKLAHQSRETVSVATIIRRGGAATLEAERGFKIRGVFAKEERAS